MYTRKVPLSSSPKETFFLWGPRQIGKSTLLKELYPNALRIDLLRSENFIRYSQQPYILRQELTTYSTPPLVLIDEVQKVPALLDEVHAMIEDYNFIFGLCGSSARKVKRGHANLLGGRALRYELKGLTSAELGDDFDVIRMIQHGYIPKHYLSENPKRLLDSYLANYLKEEIAEEGAVRQLPLFGRFLEVAAISDTEIINFSNIARECHIASSTVRNYFEILTDTLLGEFLEPYRKKRKREPVASPKFYFFDAGLVNVLSRRGRPLLGSEAFGKALENWVHHELRAYLLYNESSESLSYWRTSDGQEIDFVIGEAEFGIEVKASSSVHDTHLKGLRNFREEFPEVKQLFMISMDPTVRKTEDGIYIFPAKEFAQKLWNNDLIIPSSW